MGECQEKTGGVILVVRTASVPANIGCGLRTPSTKVAAHTEYSRREKGGQSHKAKGLYGVLASGFKRVLSTPYGVLRSPYTIIP